MADPLSIGNCSGFYGDRLSAMREMLTGTVAGRQVDVVTGDYLAELTMLILGKEQLKDPKLGYARTFVRQLEDCLGLALERGMRIVSNAGGLNPTGLAEAIAEVAAGLGLEPSVAVVTGDDVRRHVPNALTANAYLGAFGIARALDAKADIVVTGRVTDASLAVGPAIAHHGWSAADLDELAGAVIAGHVIECGTQATGGNFSGFRQLSSPESLGFPIAEVAADGRSIITKPDGTGGAVTVDTVTAQLMYEIQSERYLGPDVTARLDTVHVTQAGTDRVQISQVRGERPPDQLKVAVNTLGGFRNQLDFVLTGLELDAKEAWLRQQLRPSAAEVTWSRGPAPVANSETEEGASMLLRCSVKDPDAGVAGKQFTAPAVELALASYPGFTLTSPPAPARPYGVYRAAYLDRDLVEHTVVLPDGTREIVEDRSGLGLETGVTPPPPSTNGEPTPPPPSTRGEPTLRPHSASRSVPLGTFVHARSGDKGGDANLGLWVASDADPRREARVAWLLETVTPEWVRALLPEAERVSIYQLPNLGGINVVLHDFLGEGVAASTRFDPQAKAVGEWARSRHVALPEELL